MRESTMIRALALLMLTILGIGVFLLFARPGAAVPPAPQEEAGDNPYAQFRIPEFTLTGRDGGTVTHAALDDEITVVDFFFTSCPLFCPGMTQAMKRVQDETAGTGLRLMSISIDGDIDTPEIVGAYADRYGADPSRWRFVTGDPSVVASIVSEGLRFDLGDPRVEDTGRLINHPTRLILLGPDRRVIGLYRYDDPAEIDTLIAEARARLGG